MDKDENLFYFDNIQWYLKSPEAAEDRKKLLELGCKLLNLDQANKIKHQCFFDALCTRQSQPWPMYEALPEYDSGEFIHIAIPYDTDEHLRYSEERSEYTIDDNTISEIIEKHIDENFMEKKYLFSANPRFCLAMQFEKFTYDILMEIYSQNLNTPFVLFDEAMDKCFLFHFDLCITIYSRKNSLKNSLLAGKPDEFWIHYFNENFIKGIVQGNEHHLNVINTNYVPRLPGISKFFFKDGNHF